MESKLRLISKTGLAFANIRSAPRSVDKRWAEVGHRARHRDGEAVDWAFGETGAGKSGATPLHPAGDGGPVEWMIEAEDAQTLPHRIPVAV